VVAVARPVRVDPNLLFLRYRCAIREVTEVKTGSPEMLVFCTATCECLCRWRGYWLVRSSIWRVASRLSNES
jgi:hypothetical protein